MSNEKAIELIDIWINAISKGLNGPEIEDLEQIKSHIEVACQKT